MALHKDFPTDPHVILDPALRWFPADESLRDTGMEKLMPPLVATLRRKVQEFRDGGYVGACPTSASLLRWWFEEPHLIEQAHGPSLPFQYFFAQREAIETIVYLHDVVGAKDKHDLMRFDSSGAVSSGMFDESWRRYVVKMATGAGKTKVLSLALALRNLSELAATKGLIEAFKKGVNELTISDKGDAEISSHIRLRNVRPFVVKEQAYVVAKRSLFNRIIGDSDFELEFAGWLDKTPDVQSFAKNYFAVNFRLDYVKDDGSLSNYYPDFIVKLTDGRIVIVETKGHADVDVEPKMRRLTQWCEDVNRVQGANKFDFVYVDQKSFEQYRPTLVQQLLTSFREFKQAKEGEIYEHSLVQVRLDVTADGYTIPKGTKGTIVDIYANGKAFAVEFPGIEPSPAVVTMSSDSVELVVESFQ